MLNKNELLILTAASTDGTGEYCVSRDWNKAWGVDYEAMKNLEGRGFMKIKSTGRVPQSQQYARRSVITEAGRAALATGAP